MRERWRLRSGRTSSADLGRQLERVRALLDAGRAVNSARELEEVLQTILNRALGLLAASTGSVMLRDGEELVVVAASGNDAAIHQRVKIGAAISGRVASERRPEVITGHVSSLHFPGLDERGTRVDSGLSVPMVDRNELIGVLNVGVLGSRLFNEADVELLSAFAEHAATAIAKTRLYEAARKATAELAYSATHDELTLLPNRALLADRIDSASRDSDGGAVQGALLFVDIDGFKAVNDDYGHGAGDAVLCDVAARMRHVAPVGATPARVGGDELALFVPDVVVAADAEAIATALVESARRPITVVDDQVVVTLSVGIALAAVHGCNYADLMTAADRALYEAKRAGKNCWRMSRPVPLTVAGDPQPRQRRRWSDVSGAGRGRS